MTHIETYIVDSFTNEAFKGNPAGVCLLNQPIDESTMLKIAKELGLSETAFVQQKEGKNYSIRYFSPKLEIPLCGHATLASAKVLFEKFGLPNIQFETIQNIQLQVSRENQQIEMEFPVYETATAYAPNAMLDALGIKDIENCEYNQETNIILIEIKDSGILRGLQPDYSALVKSYDGIHGVLVTAESKDEQFDFESRFFWPWAGTNEDPVTGGTHTFLTPYWSTRLNKTKMQSFQCSERSGFMEVELIDNKLMIRSEAQIVLSGQINI